MSERELSGAEWAQRIRHAADAAGLPVSRFMAPLGGDPWSLMQALELARRPKPTTIARVSALLNGTPIPPAGPNPFRRGRLQPSIAIVRTAGEDLAARIEADQARLRQSREHWLRVEQQRYALPRRGRMLEDMPA